MIAGKKTFCLITGASRGIGKEIAMQLAQVFAEESVIVITGRKLTSLEETAAQIRKCAVGVKVLPFVLDHETATITEYLNVVKQAAQALDFDIAILIHNAGSIGDIDKLAFQHKCIDTFDRYFRANVTQTVLLSSAFLEHFADEKIERFIVNISSKLGLEPARGFSLYSTGKAARYMYFRSLATDLPSVRVVNYSPGPVETDMMTEISNSKIDSVNEMAASIRKDGMLLKPDVTVRKLVEVLEKNDFENAAHLDYFDLIK